MEKLKKKNTEDVHSTAVDFTVELACVLSSHQPKNAKEIEDMATALTVALALHIVFYVDVLTKNLVLEAEDMLSSTLISIAKAEGKWKRVGVQK